MQKTQHETIIRGFCLLKRQGKDWALPQDFMQSTSFFVGYEASARLSELASEFPIMIESQRNGRQLQRRIRWESMTTWWPTIPTNFQSIFLLNGQKPGAEQATLI